MNRAHKTTLFHHQISRTAKIAYICSPRLGDSLIGLVMVNNLLRNGYHIDVYGNHAAQLQSWFPQFTIFPADLSDTTKTFKHYDYVLHMYESDLSKKLATSHPNSIVFADNCRYHAKMSMVDIQVKLCIEELGLTAVSRNNGIQAPVHLTQRKYPNRVIIHPTSFLPQKNWPAYKFLKLARQLRQEKYDVQFIVAPPEQSDWQWLTKEGFMLHACSCLADVASLLYESGFFIGNDSGIGHLASNVGLPTVSLILRKSVARQWRPAWAPGKVVLSPSWLNPRPIKEKLWKVFTTVKNVKKTFAELVREYTQA